MDITKQHHEQQEAKRLQGRISSFVGDFQIGTLLNDSTYDRSRTKVVELQALFGLRHVQTVYLRAKLFQTALGTACAIRTISLAISSGDRIKSIHPLAIALRGISGCPAVSGS